MQALAEGMTCGAMTALARDDLLRMRQWRTLTDLHAQVTGPSHGEQPPAPALRQDVVPCPLAKSASAPAIAIAVPFRFDEATRRRVTIG